MHLKGSLGVLLAALFSVPSATGLLGLIGLSTPLSGPFSILHAASAILIAIVLRRRLIALRDLPLRPLARRLILWAGACVFAWAAMRYVFGLLLEGFVPLFLATFAVQGALAVLALTAVNPYLRARLQPFKPYLGAFLKLKRATPEFWAAVVGLVLVLAIARYPDPIALAVVRENAWREALSSFTAMRLPTAAQWAPFATAVREAAPLLTAVLFVPCAVVVDRLVLRPVRMSRGGLRARLIRAFAWAVGVVLTWAVLSSLLLGPGAVPRSTALIVLAAMMAMAGALHALNLVLATRPKRLRDITQHPERARDPATRAELVRGGKRGQKTAWVISYTGVSNEPRVLRQCRALLDNGWEVVVCGFDGHSQRPDDWFFVRLPSADSYRSGYHRALRLAHVGGTAVSALSGGREPLGLAGRVAQGTHALWRHFGNEMMRIARENPDLTPELVIAHDWFTADNARRLARRYKAKLTIDCHEYAPGQYLENPEWTRKTKPIVDVVHRRRLEQADLVTTVCDGIAELLTRENALKRPAVVVRSLPFKNVQAFRPVGERIKVLYHGDLSERREIHTALKSMPRWKANLDLVLRGSGTPQYMDLLHTIVRQSDMKDRVTFEPPVPFDRIVPSANEADIGFFSFRDLSPQVRFTLPNKFFEYIMGGLAICVTDLPEVAKIVRQYGLGKLIPQHNPATIAETLNSFTADDIETYKRASIKASETLNWEAEQKIMLEAYESLGPWH